jgi:hypothetical protein
MDHEFLNAYIKNLLDEIGELHKSKILSKTELDVTKSINIKLNARIVELEAQIQTLLAKSKPPRPSKTEES